MINIPGTIKYKNKILYGVYLMEFEGVCKTAYRRINTAKDRLSANNYLNSLLKGNKLNWTKFQCSYANGKDSCLIMLKHLVDKYK